MQSECSDWSPMALSLHQYCPYIECPYKETLLYLTDRRCFAGDRQHVQLVAQIHDELLFEVNAQRCDAYVIAGKCRTVWQAHSEW